MRLIDSHCHLDAPAFDLDRDAVIARAHAAGVAAQIIPAVTAAGWSKQCTVCALDAGLFPVYGLHPMFVAEHRPEHVLQLREWIERERPVAVGECGLDYFVPGLDREAQQYYFEAQLKLAREFDLPVIIHARRAVDAVIASIRRIGGLRGVVHSFAGSLEQAQRLWQSGFLIGLGGAVTWPRAQRLRRVAASMPLESLLLETDAPDQPDSQIPGQRNEPARLSVILAEVAQARQQPQTQIADASWANAVRLFELPFTRAARYPALSPPPQMRMRR